ncbi:hypothetical protein [Xenorhabdus japonica]|uniref:Phage tail fibre repeat-containing protein n=1 Tax=Xenorhabdus japonica TaxID=53341 RepID=A0A1I5DFM1_9GAMM|nr:hypothetical protein [Xenorhabdus japonica]SFN97990.1 hypothetical protein SAMN05421579_1402 [Xenorhabdus japonica]
MTKTFKVPFAAQGDRFSIPDEVQADGAVSYAKGYGSGYGLDPNEDPTAMNIEREKMNGIFHDITEAVGEMQTFGTAQWNSDAQPYPMRVLVYHNKKIWQSRLENNREEPETGISWVELKADLTAGEVDAYSKEESNQLFQPKGNYALAGNYALKGESYTKSESDAKYQPVGNYLTDGYSYSKDESNNRYQPKGNYAPAGNYSLKGESYTKSESDSKYQSKGNYQPAGNYAVRGESYTKRESDSKYQPSGNYQPVGNYALRGESYTKGESDGRYLQKDTGTRRTQEKTVWYGWVQDSGDMVCTENIAGCLVYIKLDNDLWMPLEVPVNRRVFITQWPAGWWGRIEFIPPSTLRWQDGSQIMVEVVLSK